MAKTTTQKNKSKKTVTRSLKPKLITKAKTKSKSKSLELLSRNDLAKKVQWLMDLGGTDDIMEALIEDMCGKRVKVLSEGTAIPKIRKNMLVFLKGAGDSGHWVFYNDKGVKMDPYEFEHQRRGSHQFCQTFSLLYAVSFCQPKYKTRFTDKLKAGQAHLGDNVRVAVDFWRHMFTEYSPEMQTYLIEEARAINNELLQHIETRGTRKPETNAIAADSDTIDLAFILTKLADIDLYADQIAKNI